MEKASLLADPAFARQENGGVLCCMFSACVALGLFRGGVSPAWLFTIDRARNGYKGRCTDGVHPMLTVQD